MGCLELLRAQCSFGTSGRDCWKKLVLQVSGAYPAHYRVWKSLSGTDRYQVRLDGEFIYAERVFSRVDLLERVYEGVKQPEDIYRKMEAKKSGNLYAGKVRYGGTCTTGLNTRSCAFQDQVEFILVTPTRIEGAILDHPFDARFDCRKCEFSQPKRIFKFTWIPE
jgi:hypothetical protein